MELQNPEENDALKAGLTKYTAGTVNFLSEGIEKVAEHLQEDHQLNGQVVCTVIVSALASCMCATMDNMAEVMQVELQHDELEQFQRTLINMTNAKLDEWVLRHNTKQN